VGHFRIVTRAAAAAAALALLVFAPAALAGGSPVFDGPTIKNPSVPPDFALRDQNGHVVHLGAERGHVVLLTFLYTHCTDVCPLTAEHLNRALIALGRRAENVRVLAVSVDPKGDTPAAVRRFVRLHRLRPQFHYLTGSAAALRPIWAAYGVKSTSQAGGLVDHTLYTLLLDRSLRGRVVYDSTATTAAIAHDARLLLATS
jgi:protein SCO1